MNMPSKNRTITGWLKLPFIRKGVQRFLEVSTPLSASKECWLTLKGFCSSKQKVEQLAKRHRPDGTLNPDYYSGFKSYIRQAENFYNGALTVNFESKPLLFYYCYLNLVKALLLLNGAKYLEEQSNNRNGSFDENHGVKPDYAALREKKFRLSSQGVIFKSKGIATDLYRHETDFCPSQDLKICVTDLFRYIPEIMYQVGESELGKLRYLPGHYYFLANNKDYWTVVRLPAPDLDKQWDSISNWDPLYKNFFNKFEQFSPDPNGTLTRGIFKMDTIDVKKYSFYQSKSVIPEKANGIVPSDELMRELDSALAPTAIESVGPEDVDFYLYPPLEKNKGGFVNEFLSIYLLTFYFSELVRYKPFQIDRIANSEDRWLMESFIETSHIRIMRYFVARLLKEVHVHRVY